MHNPTNLLLPKVMKSSLLVTKNALEHHSNEMILACLIKFVFLLQPWLINVFMFYLTRFPFHWDNVKAYINVVCLGCYLDV